MRIAFLNSWILDRARGSGTAGAIAGLAGGLEARGHRVDVVGPRVRSGNLLLRRLIYNLELTGRFSAGDYGLIVGFDIDGCFWSPGEGTPYVVCLHGVAADEMRFERGSARLYLRALARLEERNARRASRVVVTSEYSRGVACETYGLAPERVAVVPNGIDLAAWGSPGGARPRRGGEGPLILSVARQYPRKNTKALIAAMPAVRAGVPGARLRVVGGGPMLPALREQVRALGLGGAVELTGQVAGDEEVRAAYRGAEVFCLPTLQEGFGIVFLEAMAAGLPVVAFEAAAVPEVVGGAGLLAPPGDGGALAGALIRLLRDEGLRKRLGAAGRVRARAYDWPRVAGRFLEAVGLG